MILSPVTNIVRWHFAKSAPNDELFLIIDRLIDLFFCFLLLFPPSSSSFGMSFGMFCVIANTGTIVVYFLSLSRAGFWCDSDKSDKWQVTRLVAQHTWHAYAYVPTCVRTWSWTCRSVCMTRHNYKITEISNESSKQCFECKLFICTRVSNRPLSVIFYIRWLAVQFSSASGSSCENHALVRSGVHGVDGAGFGAV